MTRPVRRRAMLPPNARQQRASLDRTSSPCHTAQVVGYQVRPTRQPLFTQCFAGTASVRGKQAGRDVNWTSNVGLSNRRSTFLCRFLPYVLLQSCFVILRGIAMLPTTVTIASVRCAPTAGKSRSNINDRWSAFDRVFGTGTVGFMHCPGGRQCTDCIVL